MEITQHLVWLTGCAENCIHRIQYIGLFFQKYTLFHEFFYCVCHAPSNQVLCIDLSQHLSLHPITCSLPLSRIKERNRRAKLRKTCRSRLRQFKKGSKDACMSKAKQCIHLLFCIGKQMSRHFLESQTSAHAVVTWENKCHYNECPTLLLLSATFYC